MALIYHRRQAWRPLSSSSPLQSRRCCSFYCPYDLEILPTASSTLLPSTDIDSTGSRSKWTRPIYRHYKTSKKTRFCSFSALRWTKLSTLATNYPRPPALYSQEQAAMAISVLSWSAIATENLASKSAETHYQLAYAEYVQNDVIVYFESLYVAMGPRLCGAIT